MSRKDGHFCVQPTHVYRREDFYLNDQTGKPDPKHLVISRRTSVR
jgi:hypothetical protein